MSSEAEIYATISDYELMLEALDERRKELNLSCNELDDLASIATGYFAKCAGGSRTKTLGWHSVFKVSKRLGLRLVFEIDPAATAATLAAARPRQARQARPNNFAQRRVSKRLISRVQRYFGLRSAAARKRKIAQTAIEANGRPPAAKLNRKPAAPTSLAANGRHNGKDTAAERKAKRPVPAAGAFDAPMVEAMSELEEIAEASSIRVSREDGERRGRKRGMVAVPFPSPMDQHAIRRRTQARILSMHAKPVTVYSAESRAFIGISDQG